MVYELACILIFNYAWVQFNVSPSKDCVVYKLNPLNKDIYGDFMLNWV